MGGIRWSGFRTRVFGLIGIVLLGAFIKEYMHYQALETVKIDGPLYQKIITEANFYNDLTPPQLVIRTSYPQVLYLYLEENPARLTTILSNLERAEKDNLAAYESWMGRLPDGPMKDLLRDEVQTLAGEYFRVIQQEVIPLATNQQDKTNKEKIGQLIRTTLRDLVDKQLQACTKLGRMAQASSQQVEADSKSTIRLWLNALLIAFVIKISITVAYAWWISGSLLKSLGQVTERLRAMSQGSGDLTSRISVHRQDEVGALATAANELLDKFHTLVVRIRESSLQLYTTSTEIAATAREQEATMQGLGSSTQQIAVAVKQISATSAELSHTMRDVTEGGNATNRLAASGRVGLTSMAGTMQRLAESTNSISGKLNVVRQKANDINVVITTITKVADQTNLLSINAAIEAEKAGEYGRGFLVVAREIRRLADQTAVATLDIENMVRQMQAAVSSGVMEMDKFTEEVRSGVAAVSEINGQMSQIIEQVHGLNDRFTSVSLGMTQQSQGAGQINDAMSGFVAGVQQTSASLKEFQSVTEHLRDAADQLKSQVALFKTAD